MATIDFVPSRQKETISRLQQDLREEEARMNPLLTSAPVEGSRTLVIRLQVCWIPYFIPDQLLYPSNLWYMHCGSLNSSAFHLTLPPSLPPSLSLPLQRLESEHSSLKAQYGEIIATKDAEIEKLSKKLG